MNKRIPLKDYLKSLNTATSINPVDKLTIIDVTEDVLRVFEAGTSGFIGIAGSSGTSGTTGSSGTSGVSGVIGSSGTMGTSGSSGVNGSSGSSGTSGVTPTFDTHMTFNSRSAVINATIPSDVSSISVTGPRVVLHYIRGTSRNVSAVTSNGGTVNWTPANIHYPQHFGAVGDGTTNDTIALRNCFISAVDRDVDGLGLRYLVDVQTTDSWSVEYGPAVLDTQVSSATISNVQTLLGYTPQIGYGVDYRWFMIARGATSIRNMTIRAVNGGSYVTTPNNKTAGVSFGALYDGNAGSSSVDQRNDPFFGKHKEISNVTIEGDCRISGWYLNIDGIQVEGRTWLNSSNPRRLVGTASVTNKSTNNGFYYNVLKNSRFEGLAIVDQRYGNHNANTYVSCHFRRGFHVRNTCWGLNRELDTFTLDFHLNRFEQCEFALEAAANDYGLDVPLILPQKRFPMSNAGNVGVFDNLSFAVSAPKFLPSTAVGEQRRFAFVIDDNVRTGGTNVFDGTYMESGNQFRGTYGEGIVLHNVHFSGGRGKNAGQVGFEAPASGNGISSARGLPDIMPAMQIAQGGDWSILNSSGYPPCLSPTDNVTATITSEPTEPTGLGRAVTFTSTVKDKLINIVTKDSHSSSDTLLRSFAIIYKINYITSSHGPKNINITFNDPNPSTPPSGVPNASGDTVYSTSYTFLPNGWILAYGVGRGRIQVTPDSVPDGHTIAWSITISAVSVSRGGAVLSPATVSKPVIDISSAVANSWFADAILKYIQGSGDVPTNFRLGREALQSNTTGACNVAVGQCALRSNTVGIGNVSLGVNSLRSSCSGSDNVSVGRNSMFLNISGSFNTAVGSCSLRRSCADHNTAIGFQSLYKNTLGCRNIAIGSRSLYNNEVSNQNIAIGCDSLFSLTTGTGSIAIGDASARNVSTGVCNVFMGYRSGRYATSASHNVIIGHSASLNGSTFEKNVSVGRCAHHNAGTSTLNVAIGYRTLKDGCASNINVAVGACSLGNLVCGDGNVAVGYKALHLTTTSSFNTAIGMCALHSNTSGNYNIAIGTYSLCENASGTCNIAIGSFTLRKNTVGIRNIGIGIQSLACNTSGSGNIAVGTRSMQCNTLGCNNIGIGNYTLCRNSTGKYNVAVGLCALNDTTVGNGNIAVGVSSLFCNNTGSYNIAMGAQALSLTETASYNIAIGHNAGYCITTATNTISVGCRASASDITHETRWGNGFNTVNCIAASWSHPSDCRDKINIEPLPVQLGLDFVTKLNPVQFNWDHRDRYVLACGYDYGVKDGTLSESTKSYGIVAQELKKILDDMGIQFGALKYSEQNDAYSVTYEEIIPILIRAIQELYAMVSKDE